MLLFVGNTIFLSWMKNKLEPPLVDRYLPRMHLYRPCDADFGMERVDFVYGQIFEVKTSLKTWKIIRKYVNSQLGKETNMGNLKLLD